MNNLQPHQKSTLEWMKMKETRLSPEGGVIAFAPGLGKTLLTLTLIKDTKGRTLIVVPASLKQQWCMAITRAGLTDKTCVFSYEYVRTKTDLLESVIANLACTRVVFDEAHYGRNQKTKTFKAMREITQVFKTPVWCLTGTPMFSRKSDLDTLFILTGNTDCIVRGHDEIQDRLPRLQIIEHRAQLSKEEVAKVYQAELEHSAGFPGFPARRLASYTKP